MQCEIIGYTGPHCNSCHEDSDEHNIQACTIMDVMIDGEPHDIEVCCKALAWYGEQPNVSA